jgi:hypothetical protein
MRGQRHEREKVTAIELYEDNPVDVLAPEDVFAFDRPNEAPIPPSTHGATMQQVVDLAKGQITKSSLDLGNVDNTSDEAKPVSGPQGTALNALWEAQLAAIQALDAQLQNAVQSLKDTDTHEETARKAGDNDAVQKITQEAATREAADEALAEEISTETSDREAQYNALNSALTQEAATREAADEALVEGKLNKAPDGTNQLIGADGKINPEYIPDSLLGQIIYGGVFGSDGVIAASAYAKDLNGQVIDDIAVAAYTGYYFIAQGTYTLAGIAYEIGDWAICNGDSDPVWEKVDHSDVVSSVNGKKGTVVLEKADLGLGNVDNTSDLNKPLSDATVARINREVQERQEADEHEQQQRATALADEAETRRIADEAEATIRGNAVTLLGNALADEAQARAEAVLAEETARKNADTNLAQNLANEINDRQSAVSTEAQARAEAVLAEETARKNADTIETSDRDAADTQIRALITEETAARVAGDTAAEQAGSAAVAAEAAERAASDTQIETALQAETTRATTQEALMVKKHADNGDGDTTDIDNDNENGGVSILTTQKAKNTNFRFETNNAKDSDPVAGGIVAEYQGEPTTGSVRCIAVIDSTGNIRLQLRKNKEIPQDPTAIVIDDDLINRGEVQAIADAAVAGLYGGLKTPIEKALESELPDISTASDGDYYVVSNMDVTAPGFQGRAWCNPAVSTTEWQKVVDRVYMPDGEWLALTANGQLTIIDDVQALINGAIQATTKGQANGVASLGSDGAVPGEQLKATLADNPGTTTLPVAAKEDIITVLQALRDNAKWLIDNLGKKVDTVAGKGLSTNDFSDAYKQLLEATSGALKVFHDEIAYTADSYVDILVTRYMLSSDLTATNSFIETVLDGVSFKVLSTGANNLRTEVKSATPGVPVLATIRRNTFWDSGVEGQTIQNRELNDTPYVIDNTIYVNSNDYSIYELYVGSHWWEINIWPANAKSETLLSLERRR